MNLLFWQPNFTYAPNSYIFDGTGNIQKTTGGGISGATAPVWTLTTTTDNTITWAFIGFGVKGFALQRAQNPIGPFSESLLDAVSYSRGASDAGKYVLLDSTGQLDPSMGGGGGGGSAFNSITSGDNTTAVMTVDSGASLSYLGTGVINASEWAGTPITGSPALGKIPIGQGTTAAWADPLVQGVYDPGTNTTTGGISGGFIKPVLVGGSDYAGTPLLHDLKVDSSGNIYVGNFPTSINVGTVTTLPAISIAAAQTIAVTNTGTFAAQASCTQSTSPWVVSGTVIANQGTSPWVVSLASTTITSGTVAVTQSTSPWVVSGGLTHNSAAPSTNNVGVLPAVANAAAPIYNEGDQVLLSTDLSGTLRVNATFSGTLSNNITEWASTTLGAPTAFGTAPSGNVIGVNSELFAGATALTATGSSLDTNITNSTIAVTQSTSPWVVSNGGTFAVQEATLDGCITANKVAVNCTQVTSPWVVSLTSTTITGTVGVTQSTSPWVVSNGGTFAVQAACTQSTSPWVVSNGGTFAVQATGTVTANQGTAAASTAPWYTNPGSPTTASWTQAAITFSGSGDNTVVAAVAAQTIRVMRMFFVNSDSTNATNITIKDSTPTSFSGAFRLGSGGSFNGDSGGEPLYVTASGKGFVLNSSAAVQVSGTIWYTQS